MKIPTMLNTFPYKYLSENKPLRFIPPFLPVWVKGIYCLEATLGVE